MVDHRTDQFIRRCGEHFTLERPNTDSRDGRRFYEGHDAADAIDHQPECVDERLALVAGCDFAPTDSLTQLVWPHAKLNWADPDARLHFEVASA